MKIEIDMGHDRMGKPNIQKFVDMEKNEHPWMSDFDLMHLVKDHLKENPDYYGEESQEHEENGEMDEGTSEEQNAGILPHKGMKPKKPDLNNLDNEDPFKDYQ